MNKFDELYNKIIKEATEYSFAKNKGIDDLKNVNLSVKEGEREAQIEAEKEAKRKRLEEEYPNILQKLNTPSDLINYLTSEDGKWRFKDLIYSWIGKRKLTLYLSRFKNSQDERGKAQYQAALDSKKYLENVGKTISYEDFAYELGPYIKRLWDTKDSYEDNNFGYGVTQFVYKVIGLVLHDMFNLNNEDAYLEDYV